MRVHLVLRHPPSPFNHKLHLAAAEVMAVHLDKGAALADVKTREQKPGRFIFSVQTKAVKAIPSQGTSPTTTERN